MYKNRTTGFYEDDFRRESVVPRLHISYGTKKKEEATRLHAVMLKLFKSKDAATLEAIRSGAMTVQQVARLVDDGKPLLTHPGGAWPSVTDGVAAYLYWLETNPKKADGTLAAATSQLIRFTEWLGGDADLALDGISTKRVSEYQAHLIGAGFAINTVIASVWRVGSLYRWHRDTEFRDAQEAKRPPLLLHVPIDPDVIATVKTRRDRWLTEAEAERLFAACPPRLLCPVAIGLFAGLRVDEVLHLRPAFDIDLERWLFTVQPQPASDSRKAWRPKGGKRRHVPIAPPLRPILAHHLARYASEDWLCPAIADRSLPYNRWSFDQHFRQIVGDAELIQGRKHPAGVVFHTLRHTFASWLIMRGADLYTVAQLLGNSLKMVEGVYGHLAPDFKAAAVNKLAGAVAIPELPQGDGPAITETPLSRNSATETATTEGTQCRV